METFEIEVHRVPARTPLSLRVPTPLLEDVQRYADDHGITRTDAFLRLVELGLETAGDISQRDRLAALEQKMDRVLELLADVADAR